MEIMKILKIMFLFSIAFLTSLISLNLKVTMLSFLISFLLIYKCNLVEKILIKNNYLNKKIEYLLSLFLSIYTLEYFISFISYKNAFILALLALPSVYSIYLFLIRKILPIIVSFFKNLSRDEKIFFFTSTIIITITIGYVYSKTNAFYYPISNQTHYLKGYDIIYTTDNGALIHQDSFKNFKAPENDLRQPLFALFAFPFGIIATIITSINVFIPPIVGYSFMISFVSVILLSVIAILISRMITKKDSLLVLFLFSSTFPFLLFAINIEQYVIATFWLILLIYNWIEKKSTNPLLFSAAAGTIMTSGILLPIILFRNKFKTYILKMIQYGLTFFTLIVISGVYNSFILGLLDFDKFKSFMGIEVSFYSKLLQYINFISNCFITPTSIVKTSSLGIPTYQLAPVNSVNIVGVVILTIVIISFIINRNKKIAQLSFGWIIYSFIILCYIGWGTAENGLNLYSLYFSWAFFILLYLFIQKIFTKDPIRKVVLSGLIIILLIININGMLDIINFGIENYPASNNTFAYIK